MAKIIYVSFPKAVSETPIHNLLTAKETAEYLRIPIPTVYDLVQRGKIPAIQIGGRWRIKKSSLDRDVLHQDKQGQPTVLVVDDDPGLQDLLRTFLKKIGLSRVVVGTAKEAIKSLGKQKFDSCFWTCIFTPRQRPILPAFSGRTAQAISTISISGKRGNDKRKRDVRMTQPKTFEPFKQRIPLRLLARFQHCAAAMYSHGSRESGRPRPLFSNHLTWRFPMICMTRSLESPGALYRTNETLGSY
jgi:excisionase family DNA binding protein